MDRITLSPRLVAIASMVPKGAFAADIGTDHGYIPVWLVRNEICARVIASDIRPGPLDSARHSAAAYGVSNEIEFVLADGLEGCPQTVDTVMIAGMGGENIAGILERAPWTKNDVLLLLQPMTKSFELRIWLKENGYKVIAERLVRDSGKIYPVIAAAAGTDKDYLPGEAYTGKVDLVSEEELFPEYLSGLIERQERILEALKRSNKTEDAEKYKDACEQYEGLKDIKRRFLDGDCP